MATVFITSAERQFSQAKLTTNDESLVSTFLLGDVPAEISFESNVPGSQSRFSMMYPDMQFETVSRSSYLGIGTGGTLTQFTGSVAVLKDGD